MRFRAGFGSAVVMLVLLFGLASGVVAVSSGRVVRHGSRSVCRRFAARERRETRRVERRENAAGVRRERRLVRRCRVPRTVKPSPPGATPPGGSPGVGSQPAGVVELPVSFKVQNVNGSRAQSALCQPDGREYQIRGHLIGPRAALEDARAGSVTLYLHGSTGGERSGFDFQAVPGYDIAGLFAQAGHVSVVIDRLAYGASGHPDGNQVCQGSQADTVHQIVRKLHSGDYVAAGGEGSRFQRVALAGHSSGGQVAEIEAYSFADVDALIVLGWADQGQGQGFTHVSQQTASVCGPPRLGEPLNDDGSGPGGYVYSWPTKQAEVQDIFFNPDPAVVAAFARVRDPCESTSVPEAIAADQQFLANVIVPVLLIFGDHDALFPPPAGDLQQTRFSGSHDVTLVTLPNSGHAYLLERDAPAFRAALERWLRTHGF